MSQAVRRSGGRARSSGLRPALRAAALAVTILLSASDGLAQTQGGSGNGSSSGAGGSSSTGSGNASSSGGSVASGPATVQAAQQAMSGSAGQSGSSNGGSASSTGGTGQRPSQSDYQGSVVSGTATPDVYDLSLDDAIQRGLRTNLGLILESSNVQNASGVRLQQLQQLLPSVTENASYTRNR